MNLSIVSGMIVGMIFAQVLSYKMGMFTWSGLIVCTLLQIPIYFLLVRLLK